MSDTETVGGALARREETPSEMIAQYKGDFAMVLPSHVKPETFVRLAQGALRRDKNLALAAKSNPSSLMVSLLEAARLGLEPGTEEYYLTPRRVKGQMEVLGITGYQGEIELMYRAGAISSVVVEVVRRQDSFSYRPGRDERPIHEIDWELDDRGDLRLVYAYAVMKDGATSKVVVLNRSDIERAKKSSQGSDSQYSPWVNHEEAMWLKTAAHRLRKWVPTSAEYRREQLRAVQEVQAARAGFASPAPAVGPSEGIVDIDPPVDTETGEIVEAEIIPDDGPDPSSNCPECGMPAPDHDAGCTAA